MKKNKKSWIRTSGNYLFLLASFIVLTGMLASCKSKEKEEKIEVTILYKSDFPHLKKLVEDTYPEISLKYEKILYPSEQTRRLEKEAGPDLLVFPQASVKDNEQYLLDISDTGASTAYEGTIMERIKVDGKVYLLPFPGQYKGYIVNTTLFEKAGIPLPGSNQELVKALADMKERGIGVGEDGTNFAVDNTYNADLGIFAVGCMTPDFLGRMEGVNWLADLWEQKAQFTGNWENAFSLVNEMEKKGLLDSKVFNKQHNEIRIRTRMGNGTLAGAFGGTELYSAIQKENMACVQEKSAEPYRYQMIPFLSEEGNEPWLLLSPAAYIGINESSRKEKQEACRKILELLSTEEGQDAIFLDLQVGISYLKGYENKVDLVSSGLESYVKSGYVYHVQFPDKMVEYLGSIFRQVMTENLTIAEALHAADQYYIEGSKEIDYDLSVVGIMEHDMLVKDYNVRQEETEIGNLIADSVAEASGAPIAVVNGGGIRSSFYKGETYGEDLTAVCPYNNTIVVLEISGQTVWDMLENSLLLYNQDIPGGRFLQVSGIKYTFDSRKPAGERVVEVTLEDGTPLDMTQTYTVAVNDYMAGRQGYKEGNGDDYTVLNVYSEDVKKGDAVLKKETGMTYRDALALYFKNRKFGVISGKLEKRITDLANGG